MLLNEDVCSCLGHCVRYGEFGGGPKTGVRVHFLLQLLHSPIPLSLSLHWLVEVMRSCHRITTTGQSTGRLRLQLQQCAVVLCMLSRLSGYLRLYSRVCEQCNFDTGILDHHSLLTIWRFSSRHQAECARPQKDN